MIISVLAKGNLMYIYAKAGFSFLLLYLSLSLSQTVTENLIYQVLQTLQQHVPEFRILDWTVNRPSGISSMDTTGFRTGRRTGLCNCFGRQAQPLKMAPNPFFL